MARRRTARLHRTGRRAFTLIEIMVVIVVIAIMVASIAPSMTGGIGNVRLDAAARQIAGLMDYCYNAAPVSGQVHALVFDPEGRRFEVLWEVPDEMLSGDELSDLNMYGAILEPVNVPGIYARDMPEGIELFEANLFENLVATQEGEEESELRILFFPDGTTEFALLTLINEDGDMRTIDLNGLSGTIVIFDPTLLTEDQLDQDGNMTHRVRMIDPNEIIP